MKLTVVVALISIGTAAVGCGKKGEDESTSTPVEPQPPPASGAPTADKPGAPAAPPAPKAAETSCGADPCPCEPGSEQKFHQTDILATCKLTKATLVQGYQVAPGSVTFSQAGKLVRFGVDQEQEVLGYLADARTAVDLFPEGGLKEIWLKQPREIDGRACRANVTFYLSGKLRRCQLDKETELSGHKVHAGDWVTFDKDGTLRRWEVVDRVQKIGKHDCSGSMNFLHPTGELLQCESAKDVKIQGKAHKAGDKVCFDTAGKPADCDSLSYGDHTD